MRPYLPDLPDLPDDEEELLAVQVDCLLIMCIHHQLLSTLTTTNNVLYKPLRTEGLDGKEARASNTRLTSGAIHHHHQ